MLRRLPASVRAITRQGPVLSARSFWSSTGRKAAAATAAEEVENPYTEYNQFLKDYYADTPKHGTILYKYGAMNLWGFGILAAISKEVYVLDTIAVTGWIPDIVVLSVATWFLGPMIGKNFKQEMLKHERLKVENYETGQALFDMKIAEVTALEEQPKAMDQFIAEYEVALEEQAVAEVKIAQLQNYKDTVALLESFVAKKHQAAAKAGNVESELVFDHIHSSFQTDKNLVSKSVDEAIEALVTGTWEPKLLQSVIDNYKASEQFQADRAARLADDEE